MTWKGQNTMRRRHPGSLLGNYRMSNGAEQAFKFTNKWAGNRSCGMTSLGAEAAIWLDRALAVIII
jgi:hypothetical protein